MRSRQPERLDDLSVGGAELDRTIRELGWLDRWLGTTRRAVRAVRALEPPPDAHIVDLGCGGGHVLEALRRQWPDARLTGIDGNPHVLAQAARRVPTAEMLRTDLLAPGARIPACDVAISTQFLYHFEDSALTRFVAAQEVRVGWALVGLLRSRLARSAFGLTGPMIGLSTWTVQDGQRAIERAFRPDELRAAFPGTLEIRTGPLGAWYWATARNET